MIDNLIKVWDLREQLLRALDELPQTICHNDIFPRNVFVLPNGIGHSVAIDWAFCGRGAIGQELSALVAATLFFLESRPGIGKIWNGTASTATPSACDARAGSGAATRCSWAI